MTAVRSSKSWVRVTSAAPCPICTHDSWCVISPDGLTVRCKRTESTEPSHGDDGNAWLHRLLIRARRPSNAPKTDTAAPDPEWRERADRFAAQITDEQVLNLATTLGVDPNVLRELGIGWNGRDWTFPMFDASGEVCGVRRRTREGKKLAMTGCKLGVIRRRKPDDGVLLVCEGDSDTAAALTIGFDALGVPGAGQCTEIAAAHSLHRDVVVVADNDLVGQDGAETLVATLVKAARSVRLIRPPAEHKDLRAWLNSAGAITTKEQVEKAIAVATPISTQPASVGVADGAVPPGERDPATGRLVLCTAKTMPTAVAYVRDHHAHGDGRTLHYYGGSLWAWRDNRYVALEDAAVRHVLQPWLHGARQYRRDPETKQLKLFPFCSNNGTIKSALASLQDYTHLPETTQQPCWLTGDGPPPNELLPCRSMTLHLGADAQEDRVLLASPRLFNCAALDFDYDPKADHPLKWDEFITSLFGDDQEQRDLLQQWFGYALTADTSQQKALLVYGPKRSGKGTVARVLAKLVGSANVVAPTVSSLAGAFGTEPLLGKTLAIMSDARFTGEHVATVVERLLCITGEDAITIDRKHKTSVTVKLPTRFMVLSNELPRFTDASAALAGRFCVLKLTKSFFGAENVNLTNDLLTELPGILKWAVEGARMLRRQGRFTVPASTQAAVADIEDLSSPVGAFVRERCIVGTGLRILCRDLFQAWVSWCIADGRHDQKTQQLFGRDLAAAVPGIQRRLGTGNVPFYAGIALASGEGAS
jgi:P4 family phage/plasmid primase-like protien